jgi:pyrroloquinoline quinone (PQQ) biosynthesis protein C
MERRSRILALYDILPFREHPLWNAVRGTALTMEQILRAETQHYLRTKRGQEVRRQAVANAKGVSPTLWKAVVDTYLEECQPAGGTSHLDLISRLLTENGMTLSEVAAAIPTPGNVAAMALYADIGNRGAPCHILGAGAVEFYYSKLAPEIFDVYTKKYGMTADQAETYRIHGPMDQVHANRALAILDEAVDLLGWELIERSVRDAFVATSLHYDGMLQAALGKLTYWDGVTK